MKKITLDMLTQDSVVIVTETYVINEGIEFKVGLPNRELFENSARGRTRLGKEVAEPYKSVIFLMWGDNPTIEDMTD